MRICAFKGCGRPHFARTLCHTHYCQQRRGAHLTAIRTRRNQVEVSKRDDRGRKFCTRCEQWLPEFDFMEDSARSDGLSTYCKPCRSAHSRAWRYGLTVENLERMIHDQSGLCALCPASLADGYCVDHDHGCCPDVKTCGRCLRGLLCQECNKLLGKIEGDPGKLDRMISYVGRNL